MSDKSTDANPELVILRSKPIAANGLLYYLWRVRLMANIGSK
jgi:hypothetical protein